MKNEIIYTQKALSELKNLDKPIAKRIVKKIRYFGEQENPLKFAKKLTNLLYGEYRFRIGAYRVIFDKDKKGNIYILFILSIKHRREVYKKL